MTGKLHVLVPFWGLAGGVIKVLDYAEHGVEAGFDVTLWSESDHSDAATIASLPVLQRLLSHGVTHRRLDELPGLGLTSDDRVLFSEPAHAAVIDRTTAKLGQVIHLVQGTRHATPTWNSGLHFRLLHRPLVRVVVSDQVREAIDPHVNTRLPVHTVIEGHDIDYFAAPRSPKPNAIARVLYSTWKSDLGDRVAELVDPQVATFIAMRGSVDWPTLRNRYQNADIFLGTPGPEEGFYLPGLEAMAAGCAVVMSLVGGNAAYGESEVNMIACPYDDAAAHATALIGLAGDAQRRQALVTAGRQAADRHRLDRERDEAIAIMREPLGNYDDGPPPAQRERNDDGDTR